MVIAEVPGPAPSDHARRIASAITRVELADMAEGEGAQERPERGRRHHPERQHRRGRAGAEPVGVVDVRTAGHDRRHQREHLPPRQRATHPIDEPHRRVDQGFQPEADHQRRRQEQPRVGHQRRVVKDRFDAIERARYWLHWKCLPSQGCDCLGQPSSSLRRRHFSRMRGVVSPSLDRWIED
jgi:hypothetical protein